MIYGKEKDRLSMGVEEPAKTKNIDDGELLGTSECTHIDYRKQHYAAYRAGYDYAYDVFMPRILELEDQLRYYIKHSVAQMFQDIGFDGADNARKRSAQQFRQWYENREADAA